MELANGLTLWEHQTRLVGECVSRPYSLVYAGCATGKTLASLAVAVQLGKTRILVLTQKTPMRSVWEREIQSRIVGADCVVLDKGNSNDKAATLRAAWGATSPDRALFIVVNYETAYRLPLELYQFDLAIADESQVLKSHDSIISITLAKKCQWIPHKIAMTGTPWDDRLTDVYGQMRWLNPLTRRGKVVSSDLGVWTHFFDEYVVYYQKGSIKIPTGYKNKAALASRIKPYFSHVSQDVLKLPPAKHQYIDVPLSKGHMKIYDEMRKDMIAKIEADEITADNVLVQALRLQQIAAGHYQDAEGVTKAIPDGNAKLLALLDIVDSLGGQPFVVFTQFREDIELLQKALKVSTLRLQGGRDEHQIWQKDNTQGLLVNIAAGNAGVDLTKAAVALYYTTGYSRNDYTQSLARIRRPNRPVPVTYYHIRALKTIDIHIDKALRGKGNVALELLRDLTAL